MFILMQYRRVRLWVHPFIVRGMSQWSEETIDRFTRAMKQRRVQLGLTLDDVADRTAQLGHVINRSTVFNYESFRSRKVTVTDAIVLAAALETSLAHLLFPEMPDRKTEYLPGLNVSEWTAACRLLGIDPSGVTLAERLEHEELEDVKEYVRNSGVVLQAQLSHDLKLVQYRLKKLEETIQATGDVGLLSEATELSAKAGSLTERLESMGGIVARPQDRRGGVVDG